MKKKRLRILRQMEVLLGQMAAECQTECSEAGFAAMKRIIKGLRYMVYVCEEARINRLKELASRLKRLYTSKPRTDGTI